MRFVLKRLSYWTLALGVAVALLYVSLRGISWPGVWVLVSRAAAGPLALSLLVASFSLFVRAVRWRLLLGTAGEVTIASVFAAISAGYCGNLFLPARAGELIRMLMVHRASGLSKAFILTTELCERVCDAVALLLIGSLALLGMPARPGWFARAAAPFLAIAIAGVLGVALLPKLEPFLRPRLDRIPLPARFQSKLGAIAEHVAGGLRTLHHSRVLLAFTGLTAVAWFADACTALLVMHSLALPGTLLIALLLNTGLGLGSALPATPGYVGVYQFVAVSVLVPFGFSKTGAIGYILLFQVLQYVLISLWAAFGALVWRGKSGSPAGTIAAFKEGRA